MDIRRVLPFLFVVLILIPASALAQGAWLPGEGRASFAISYQWLNASNHIFSSAVEGSELSPIEEWLGFDFPSKVDPGSGTSQSMAVVLDADIGITDRLAVFGGLAFIAPRYLGAFPYPTVPGDDGKFHGTFQDARIGARFAAVDDGSWMVTPFAAVVFPTHDYPVLGHSAPGVGLKQRLGGRGFETEAHLFLVSSAKLGRRGKLVH